MKRIAGASALRNLADVCEFWRLLNCYHISDICRFSAYTALIHGGVKRSVFEFKMYLAGFVFALPGPCTDLHIHRSNISVCENGHFLKVRFDNATLLSLHKHFLGNQRTDNNLNYNFVLLGRTSWLVAVFVNLEQTAMVRYLLQQVSLLKKRTL